MRVDFIRQEWQDYPSTETPITASEHPQRFLRERLMAGYFWMLKAVNSLRRLKRMPVDRSLLRQQQNQKDIEV